MIIQKEFRLIKCRKETLKKISLTRPFRRHPLLFRDVRLCLERNTLIAGFSSSWFQEPRVAKSKIRMITYIKTTNTL